MPWAAHAAAVKTSHNFQGNPRLARLMGYSLRTAQRARAWFERRGLIRSELLYPGDQLPGMNRPVRRYMVARDVSELQQLAELGDRYVPPHRRRKPSAAELRRSSHTVETTERVSPAELIAFTSSLAQAAAGHSPASPLVPGSEPKHERAPFAPGEQPATIEPSEIDEWDERTRELERSQAPPRGPPS